jgi:hypothetical protein
MHLWSDSKKLYFISALQLAAGCIYEIHFKLSAQCFNSVEIVGSWATLDGMDVSDTAVIGVSFLNAFELHTNIA